MTTFFLALILIFRGPPCTGKSTVAQQLGYPYVDEDTELIAHFDRFLEKRFPGKWDQNAYFAIRHSLYLSDPPAEAGAVRKWFDDPKNDLSFFNKELRAIIFEKVEKGLKESDCVILEAPTIKTEEIEEPCLNILFYAPLDILFERLDERNRRCYESGDLRNYRFHGRLLSSFLTHFTVNDNPEGAIGEIPPMYGIFETIERRLGLTPPPRQRFSFGDYAPDQFYRYRLKTFTKNAPLYVHAKTPYDILITNEKDIECLRLMMPPAPSSLH